MRFVDRVSEQYRYGMWDLLKSIDVPELVVELIEVVCNNHNNHHGDQDIYFSLVVDFEEDYESQNSYNGEDYQQHNYY